MKRRVLLICALLVGAAYAGPIDPAKGICEDQCDPLTVPKEVTGKPKSIGQVIFNMVAGMAGVAKDMMEGGGEPEPPEPPNPALIAAKIGLGALLPLIDFAINPNEEPDPMEVLRRDLDEDLVKMQDYLVCKMDSLIGQARDAITKKMDSTAVNRFNSAVDRVSDWVQQRTCGWNCLNYTSVEPSKRNCVSGLTCLLKSQFKVKDCANTKTWDPLMPDQCQVFGKYGVCGIDGHCYTTDADFADVRNEIKNLLDIVFLSNSDITAFDNLNEPPPPANRVDLNDFQDLVGLIGLSKLVLLKMTLYQQLIFLGDDTGVISDLRALIEEASKNLQGRYDAYTSTDAVRATVLKFSTPMQFDAQGTQYNSLADVPTSTAAVLPDDKACGWMTGFDIGGAYLPNQPQTAADPQTCCARCQANDDCINWTFILTSQQCILRGGMNGLGGPNFAVVSGTKIKNCGVWEAGVDYWGGEMTKESNKNGGDPAASPQECCNRCQATAGCKQWSYNAGNSRCFLKNGVTIRRPGTPSVISGTVQPSAPISTVDTVVPGRLLVQNFYQRVYDAVGGKNAGSDNEWQTLWSYWPKAPDSPANGYVNLTAVNDLALNCDNIVLDEVNAGQWWGTPGVSVSKYPWGYNFDTFMESYLRGSCEDKQVSIAANCAGYQTDRAAPGDYKTLRCPTITNEPCYDGPATGRICDTCAWAWTKTGGCMAQFKSYVAQCASQKFYPMVSKTLNDMVQKLQAEVVELLAPVKGTIDALNAMKAIGGLPVESQALFMNTFYPFMGNCSTAKTSCGPIIPGPAKPGMVSL